MRPTAEMSLCVMHHVTAGRQDDLKIYRATTCNLRAVICFASQSSHECHNAPRLKLKAVKCFKVRYCQASPHLYHFLALIHIHNAD